MSEQKIAELSGSISAAKNKTASAYPLPVTIINNSSIGFQKAEVAVKDEGTGDVDTVYFGPIPRGQSAQQTAHLPGGIEICIWKILPDVGDEIYGLGMANNASGVRLTITD